MKGDGDFIEGEVTASESISGTVLRKYCVLQLDQRCKTLALFRKMIPSIFSRTYTKA